MSYVENLQFLWRRKINREVKGREDENFCWRRSQWKDSIYILETQRHSSQQAIWRILFLGGNLSNVLLLFNHYILQSHHAWKDKGLYNKCAKKIISVGDHILKLRERWQQILLFLILWNAFSLIFLPDLQNIHLTLNPLPKNLYIYMKLCLICSFSPVFRFSNGFVMLCQSEESGCFKA